MLMILKINRHKHTLLMLHKRSIQCSVIILPYFLPPSFSSPHSPIFPLLRSIPSPSCCMKLAVRCWSCSSKSLQGGGGDMRD